MGVNVRAKNGKWDIFVRHHGDRAAQQFVNEDEANTVAAAVRNAIALGQFDIAAMKNRRAAKDRDEPESNIPSYASILISAGVSPAYVQEQLGHASIKLTVDTYTHLIPGAGRQALAALPGIDSQASSNESSSVAAD